jgi:arylsulfatase
MRIRLAGLIFLLLLVSAYALFTFFQEKSKNIIIISIDTLRADHMGCYGYERDTTPGLDAFSREGIVFDHAYTQASSTLPAHSSLFTSAYPDMHGVINTKDSLPSEFMTLAQLLLKKGYNTAAFVNAGWLHPKFKLDRGFRYYDYYNDLQMKPQSDKIKIGRNAEETNAAVYKWLEKHGETPFFLFIHYFDVHSDWSRLPYESSLPFSRMFSSGYSGDFKGGEAGVYASSYLSKVNRDRIRLDPDDRNYIMDLYDEGIAFADFHISSFLKNLKQMDLLDDSLIIITADHGEEFQEHGQVLHEQAYEELIHVPLIIRMPNAGNSIKRNPGERLLSLFKEQKKIFPAKRVKTLVQHIDIMPTVLDIAGIDKPPYVRGRSLLKVINGLPVQPASIFSRNTSGTQYVVRNDTWKLFFFPAENKTVLYNIVADPAETNDLSGTEVKIREKLKKELFQWKIECEEIQSRFQSDKIELDETTKEELRSLGYIE